jgi:hypothetical protein
MSDLAAYIIDILGDCLQSTKLFGRRHHTQPPLSYDEQMEMTRDLKALAESSPDAITRAFTVDVPTVDVSRPAAAKTLVAQ